MDPSKRKRAAADDPASGGSDHRKQRRNNCQERAVAGDHVVANAVSDADVEEFFAIVLRLRPAPPCIAIAGAAGKVEAELSLWRPSFVREDFEEGNGVARDNGGGRTEGEAATVRRVELDLNADPEPESDERTARFAGVQA